MTQSFSLSLQEIEQLNALIGGEMDWRDNETWYDFVDPIRREYLIKKDKEREKALSTI